MTRACSHMIPRAGAWQWDIARVQAKGLTDSVADLMAAKLNLLSVSTRQVLLNLASLGSAADVEGLAVASGRSALDVITSLRPALQGGLVARRGRAYVFAHDRVQEAAYGLGPAADKPRLHLRIGMALADHITPDDTSERLYFIANQLNRGISAITSEVERERIIAVNLSAGQRARTAAAYNAAIAYLRGCARAAWEPSTSAPQPNCLRGRVASCRVRTSGRTYGRRGSTVDGLCRKAARTFRPARR